jgi:glycerophosphoryl diester phosphodiesterase
MAYIDSANIKGTLYELQDTQARTDIGDLKSAVNDITTIEHSVNLLNPNTWMVGKNISSSGQLVNASTRVLSDFIPVTPGNTYYFAALTADGRFFKPSDNKIVGLGFYSDKDYNTLVIPTPVPTYIGQAIAPENANYVAFSFPSAYLTTGSGTPIISFTEGWYPSSADELIAWTPDRYVPANQAQVNQNTADIQGLNQTSINEVRRNGIVKTISHQGYKVNTPKSTKWAYIAAKQHGFEIAENDINFSSTTNRTVFMWHDDDFGVCGDIIDADHGYALYTDGTDYYWYDMDNEALYDLDYVSVPGGSVSGMTRVAGSSLQCLTTPWKLIKEIDVGAYYGNGEFAGTKVQTFEEWVLLCKQLGLEIYIDRKVNTIDFVPSLVEIVKKHGMLDHATWMINVTATIGQKIRDYDPNARLALITRPTSEQIPALAELASTGRGVVYDLSSAITTAETIAEALQNGFIPEAYYVPTGSPSEETIFAEIRRLVDLGCTGLTLDTYFVHEAFEYLYDDLDARLLAEAGEEE